MEDIGKTKWKKIKKDYARVCEYMKYDPIDDEVFVFYRYAKRLKRVDGGSRSESLNKQVIAWGNTEEFPRYIVDHFVDINKMVVDIVTQVTAWMLINEDPVLNSAVSTLGQSLRETEDQLARSMMEGGAPPINCTSGTNGDNPSNISPLDCSKAVRLLRTANAQFIMDLIEGEDKFGTAPVRTCFFGLTHTNLSADLDQMVGFQNVAQYANTANLLMAEWGTIRNIRFLLSSVGSITPNASANLQDVYNIFIPGQESYDMVDLDGYSAQFIYAPPEIASPRLRLYQTAGWKMAQVFNITNTSWIVNLRCTLAVAI